MYGRHREILLVLFPPQSLVKPLKRLEVSVELSFLLFTGIKFQHTNGWKCALLEYILSIGSQSNLITGSPFFLLFLSICVEASGI